MARHNVVDLRHIAEALDDVRETLRNDSNFADDDLSDAAWLATAEVNLRELRAAEDGGNAEDAYDAARRLAAVCVHYMARGLS